MAQGESGRVDKDAELLLVWVSQDLMWLILRNAAERGLSTSAYLHEMVVDMVAADEATRTFRRHAK